MSVMKVATSCCVCGTELVDATSIEFGIGPVCRRKYEYEDAYPVPPETAQKVAGYLAGNPTEFPPELASRVNAACERSDSRKAANLLVYHGSAEHGVVAVRVAEVLDMLGYKKLAARIIKRLVPIHIDRKDGLLIVKSPFNERFIEGVRKVTGRKFVGETKVWTFPDEPGNADKVWAILRDVYPGLVGIGPKGVFTVA